MGIFQFGSDINISQYSMYPSVCFIEWVFSMGHKFVGAMGIVYLILPNKCIFTMAYRV